VHAGLVTKRKQDGPDRGDQRCMVATRQVRAPNRSREQCVADEQVLDARLACTAYVEADAAWTMTRSVMRAGLAVAERDDLARRVELVHGRRRVHAKAEHHTHLDGALVEKQVVAMEVHRDTKRPLCGADPGHMIDVSMGEQNAADRQRLLFRKCEQAGNLISRIDQHGFTCALARDHEPVLKERPDSLRLDYDHVVILAILDDLMFTSKIKLAATQVGVPVGFARSAASALAEMRKNPPALVILDLNNPRTDPLGTVAAMKADAALAGIPTIGFVSHVDTVTIDAARQAGVGDILARSAFAQRLPEILARGNQSPEGTL
jgi:CheY-like chemotaxis protein